MSQYEKLLLALLSGTRDKNFQFADLQRILDGLKFILRVRGDYFIYTRSDVDEIINIQPVGSKAKPYQVRQVREIVLKYKMGGGLHEI